MMRSKHDVAHDALIDHNVFPHMTGTKDIEDQELHHVLKVSFIFFISLENFKFPEHWLLYQLESLIHFYKNFKKGHS